MSDLQGILTLLGLGVLVYGTAIVAGALLYFAIRP